jgi:hypothetical protein
MFRVKPDNKPTKEVLETFMFVFRSQNREAQKSRVRAGRLTH